MISLWELTNFTAALVLPPGLLIVIALVAVGMLGVAPRFGRWTATVALVLLYALSLPIVGRTLLKSIEAPYVDPANDKRGGAIVVLGGGSYFRAPEYGHDTVSGPALERLRYAAHLQRRIKKPILVSAGNPVRADSTEGSQMQATLKEFGTMATWVEEGSKNTFENAKLSYRILDRSGIRTIYLVTHAWHMPRARLAFEHAGFTVIPAGTGFKTTVRLMLLDFVPNASALQQSWLYFHEIAGLAWYRLKIEMSKP